MCFNRAPLQPPKIDQSLEAAKFAEATRNAERLADEKEEDTKRQRGLVYGMFGPRSFLGGLGLPSTGTLRPTGT